MVCGNLAKFLYNRTELFRFVVQNSTDGNREKDGQSICCYYLCFLSSFLNNAVFGVFLCKLVCGNVAELLYSFTELFRFILHNSTDANGKRIQRGDQSPHKMRSMFKKHLLLPRFMWYICLIWFVGTEVRFYTILWLKVISYIGAKLFAKDNLWQYTQLLRPHYWKTPLESLIKNLSSKANFFKFSINCLIAWIDLTLQRDTVIF